MSSVFVVNSATVLWAISAGVCFEAYAEAGVRGPALYIGSLIPVLNTIVAACYVCDKIKRS